LAKLYNLFWLQCRIQFGYKEGLILAIGRIYFGYTVGFTLILQYDMFWL